MKELATIIYADILGFAHLVTSNEDSLAFLDGFSHEVRSQAELRERFEEDPPDLLTRTFVAFHRLLDLRLTQLVNIDPLQSIAFSDSAFVVFRDQTTSIAFAQAFMRDLISFDVPVRMGIGRGSFRGLRLTTDISDDVRRHSSQFLGTGVLQAHHAESCGLKGLRIFIHPEAHLHEDWPGDVCEVTDETPQKEPSVRHELNYLEHLPDYVPRPGAPTASEANVELVARVTAMRDRAPAPVKNLYEQTLAALVRMRRAYEKG
jgi:hypothetical protein